MLRRAAGAMVVAALTLSLVAAASPEPNASHRGGVYRVGIEGAFPFSDALDPTGEYTTYGQVILTNLLVRTLVGYDHVAGAAGNTLVPDVATAVPQPTDGVKFGPPVDRQVTAQDFLSSFERLANPKDGAEYSFYYAPIEGFTAFGQGKAKTISGIRTPDASTIVFHLTRPTGDFL